MESLQQTTTIWDIQTRIQECHVQPHEAPAHIFKQPSKAPETARSFALGGDSLAFAWHKFFNVFPDCSIYTEVAEESEHMGINHGFMALDDWHIEIFAMFVL